MRDRTRFEYVLWSGARQPPTPIATPLRLTVTHTSHTRPSRRILLRWRRARRILLEVHHLLLVAHVAHVGVLVALRALMLVARRVGVGVAWDIVKRPGGVHCLSHRQSFPGWTDRTTTTWFYLMQARYFASKVMEEKCIVLLFYGTDCRFHGREVRSFAVLWKRMYLLWKRMYHLWRRMYHFWKRMYHLWKRMYHLWKRMYLLWKRNADLWMKIAAGQDRAGEQQGPA